jgi:hypothetical protein
MLIVPAFELVPPGSWYPKAADDVGAIPRLTIEVPAVGLNTSSRADEAYGDLIGLDSDDTKDRLINDDYIEQSVNLGSNDKDNNEDTNIGEVEDVMMVNDIMNARQQDPLSYLGLFPKSWPSKKTKKHRAKVFKTPQNERDAKQMLVNYELRSFRKFVQTYRSLSDSGSRLSKCL